MMDKKQTGMILDLIDLTYPGKLKIDNAQVFFETWHNFLQDYDYGNVSANLRKHIESSPFLPSLYDLITDKSISKNDGRYIPDAKTTYLEMQNKEREMHLALTTTIVNVEKEQILAEKEKALKTIANAVKRSEEENPYKVVE